ncbi:MAG: hypothetical protein ACFCVD_18560 [Nodosilinea sp.]
MTQSPATDDPTLPAGPGFGLTFLYYFSGTALVTTLLAVKTLGIGLETGFPNQFGLLFGAIGGLLGATVNRSTTLELPFSSQKKFRQKLEAVLAEMGYSEDTDVPLEGILVYRRPFLRQLFSGKVYVLLGHKQATLRSRVMHIQRVKRKLSHS